MAAVVGPGTVRRGKDLGQPERTPEVVDQVFPGTEQHARREAGQD